MSNSNKGAAALTPTLTPEFQKLNRENPAEPHILVTLKGRDPQEGEERKPLRIVAAVDHSGSMAGRKIEYLRASMRALVRQLSDKDYLGIVAFGSETWVVAEPTRCDQKGRETLLTQIDTLGATSMTNLSGGATEAITMLRNVDVNREDSIERVFLLTDGCPTAGVTQDDALVTLIKKAAGEDVDLTTFGYGDDTLGGIGGSYNPELLQAIANACRGNFHHITNPDAVPKALGTELGGLMTTVAQNIKVTFDLKEDVSVMEVLNDFDVKSDTDGRKTTISVDDVYIEEEKAIVARLKVPSFNKAAGGRPKKNLGIVEVQWLDVHKGEIETVKLELKLDFVKPGEADTKADPQVEKQVALLKAAEAQREAIEKANQGDFQGAQLVMNTAADGLKACALFASDSELKGVHGIYMANIGDYQAGSYNEAVRQKGTSVLRAMHTKRDAGAGLFADHYGNIGTRGMSQALCADVGEQMGDEIDDDPALPVAPVPTPPGFFPGDFGYQIGVDPAPAGSESRSVVSSVPTEDSKGYTKRRSRR